MELVKPLKDMKTVADYNRQRQMKIFKRQCFNGSVIFHSSMPNATTDDIFDFAELLYVQGLKREWLKINEDDKNEQVEGKL